MKLEIKKMTFKDLSGDEIAIDKEELCRTLGNYIYVSVQDLRWLNIAQAIHSTGECILDDYEANILKSIIKSQNCGLIIAIKEQLIKSL
jgi:hypothetical protein